MVRVVRVVREQGGQVGQGHTVLGVLDVLWVLHLMCFLSQQKHHEFLANRLTYGLLKNVGCINNKL